MASLFLLLIYAIRLGDWIPVVAMIAWTFTTFVLVRALRGRAVAGP